MAHTAEEKKKLLHRVRRIIGQVAAIEKALDQEAECSDVLHNISACRGAMDALMAEVIEGHIRYHILGQEVVPCTCRSWLTTSRCPSHGSVVQ